MVAAVNNIPVSVDYTNRDYYSIRQELITRIQSRLPDWQGSDPADFGLALVEAFAYMGDIVNYYIDRIANEAYIFTATQRQSLLNIARIYGYYPSSFKSATTSVTFTNTDITGAYTTPVSISAISGSGTVVTYTANNSFSVGQTVTITGATTSAYNITGVITDRNATTFKLTSTATGSSSTAIAIPATVIPAGTQIMGTVTYNDTIQQVIFETTDALSVPANNLGVTVGATHGETVSLRPSNYPSSTIPGDIAGYKVGVSNGQPEQSFFLLENQVVEGSVSVFVYDGTKYDQWTQVTHLVDYGPNDTVFTVATDANNYVYISFGDGVSGAIPVNQSSIKADYRVGGGLLGNITAYILDTIYRDVNGNTSAYYPFISVNNGVVGTGGADPESNESIRRSAPKAISTINRAVTLQDYADLATNVVTVGKANAYAAVWNSVSVYIAEHQDATDTNLYPGYDDYETLTLSNSWTTMATKTAEYLADKTQIGVTISIVQPTYVPVSLAVQFTALPQYDKTTVESDLQNAILSSYSYSQINFGAVISPEEIEATLRQVPGVGTVRVNKLYKTSGTSGRATILAGPGEIFVFDPANTTIVALSSNPSLTNYVDSTHSGLIFKHDTTVLTSWSTDFSGTFYHYNINVANSVSNVTVTPTAVQATVIDGNGAVTTYGTTIQVTSGLVSQTVISGTASSVITLGGGGSVTTFTITTVAGDGVATATYTVTVTRGA